MDDRIRVDDTGTLYLDLRQQEQSVQVLKLEELHGLLYYLLMAVIGVIMIFGILVALFFGFILLGIIGIMIFLATLFFGSLFLLAFLRR